MLKDSSSGFGLVTILLHWVCAILILFLFGLGIYMRGLDYYSTWYHRGPELHISLGLFVLLLMSLRVCWRAFNQTPLPLEGINSRTQLAAKIIKILLYIFTFVICITGYFITTADGQAASFFNLAHFPAIIELGAHNVDRAGLLHKYLSWGIVGIATLHGAAALFHHIVKRDKTLVRMLKPAPETH